MKYVRDTLISAADGSVNVTSAIIDSNQLISISLQAVATGTIAGTAKLQFSDDPGFPHRPDPINWNDVPSATVAVASAGSYAIPKTDLCYRWLRVVYTATSGTGTLTVNFNALSI